MDLGEPQTTCLLSFIALEKLMISTLKRWKMNDIVYCLHFSQHTNPYQNAVNIISAIKMPTSFIITNESWGAVRVYIISIRV